MALGLSKGELRLCAYCADWPRLYEQEAGRIRDAIGKHILDVQHVGSTAIPGMCAKPIIDIAVAVQSFEGAVVCVAPLVALGYQYRGEHGIPRRHYFVRDDPRTHHIHMIEQTSEDWVGLLRFRDRLRADPRLAQEYAALKTALAEQHPNDRHAYQQGKAEFITRVQDTTAAEPGTRGDTSEDAEKRSAAGRSALTARTRTDTSA